MITLSLKLRLSKEIRVASRFIKYSSAGAYLTIHFASGLGYLSFLGGAFVFV